MILYYLVKVLFENFTKGKGLLTELPIDWVFLPVSQAAFYYQLAASQGHSLAQYHYARCLLQDSASLWGPGQQRAVSMLKQAADSGLREVSAIGGASPRQVEPGSDQITFFLPL